MSSSPSTTYNDDGQAKRSTDTRGNYTLSFYDELGQLTRSEQYDATSRLLSVTRTSYIAGGKVATSTDRSDGGDLAVVGALGNLTHSYYDLAGRSVRTLSPDGTSSETLYAAAGRAYLSIDRHLAAQRTDLYGTFTLYDATGRATETRRLSGLELSIQDAAVPNAQANHLLQVTLVLPTGIASPDQLPSLSSTLTHYNSKGQVDHTLANIGPRSDYRIEPTGQKTEYLYDSAGRQTHTIQRAVPVWNATLGQNVPTDLTTETKYDALGRAYQTIDALNHATATEYDAQGRVARTLYHDGSFVEYGYDAQGRKTSQSKQLPAGATQAQIDASATLSTYNDLGQLTDVSLPAIVDNKPTSATFGQSVRPTWHYTYDKYGQQETQTDPYGHTTRFTYHPLTGQRTGRTLPAVSGVTVSESWQYDDLGRQTRHTDFSGQSTTYHYDSLGRLQIERRYRTGNNPDVTGAIADETTLTHYDALGNRDTVTLMNAAGAITRQESYGYDDQGRLTSISGPEGTIHYAYDNSTGQLTDAWTGTAGILPASSSTWTQYAYDSLGRLSTVTAKRLLGTDKNLVTTYGYTAAGSLAASLQPNGVLTSYSYDAPNRLDLETVTKDATTLASYDYALLPDGQRDYVIETDSLGGQTKIDWTYDAADRLIAETRDGGTANVCDGLDYTDTYTLDLVGNRLVKAHGWDTNGNSRIDAGEPLDEQVISTYSERDQLLSSAGDLTGSITYTYDNNGSQRTKTTGGVTTTYTWDLQNHLASIDTTTDGSADVTYRYNSAGVRVAATANGQTTFYLNDPQNPTGYTKAIEDRRDTNNDGSPDTADKAYILGTQIIGQANSASDVYFLMLDGHGSTRALTGATGCLVESYHYDAFGTPLNFDANTARTNWLFGGDGLWDPNAKFTYHLARFRDGWHFTRFDPIAPFSADPENPVELHKYLYASANPVVGSDTTGMWDHAGHYWTVYMVAVATGKYTKQQAYEMANYSELPDAFRSLDARSQAEAEIEPTLNPFVSSAVSAQQRNWTNMVQDAFHSLHGGNYSQTLARTEALAGLIQTSDGWKQGVLIHAFGDCFSHSKNDGSAWGAPLGHATSTDPFWADRITARPARYEQYITQLYSLLGGSDVARNADIAYLAYLAKIGFFGDSAAQIARAELVARSARFGYIFAFAPGSIPSPDRGANYMDYSLRTPNINEVAMLAPTIVAETTKNLLLLQGHRGSTGGLSWTNGPGLISQ